MAFDGSKTMGKGSGGGGSKGGGGRSGRSAGGGGAPKAPSLLAIDSPTFGSDVLNAAKQIVEDAKKMSANDQILNVFGNRVFISDVQKKFAGTPEQFKQALAKAHMSGDVRMSRADLNPWQMGHSPSINTKLFEKAQSSSTTLSGKAPHMGMLEQEYTYIRTD